MKNLHKTLHKYLIPHVKRLFLLVFCSLDHMFSISEYDLENGRMLRQQKYWIKVTVVKIPILILVHFCLLCWFSSVPIVAAIYFDYLECF